MKKLSALVAGAISALLLIASCNSSDYNEGEAYSYGVAIRSFSLSANKNVLAGLDSVFFSIDLPKAAIFNADSLPYGTATNKLVPIIMTTDYVSALEIIEPRENKEDTVHNYLTNPSDTISFANGPVTLRVVSADGLNEMKYTVAINVHAVKSDSLVWNAAARRLLPSSLQAPVQQKSTAGKSAVYCLTRAAESYSLAYNENPYNDTWTTAPVQLPSHPDFGSFNACGEELYIIADMDRNTTAHPVYKSADNGASWTNTGIDASYIYGACDNKLLANRLNSDSSWELVDIVSGAASALPAGMPVYSTSNMAYYKAPLGATQAVIAGGVDIQGKPVHAVWTYDGRNWASVNMKELKWLGSESVLVPFVDFLIGSNFVATEYPTLLCFGGQAEGDHNPRTVYISADYGISWQKAPDYMQLPADVPALRGAQAFVYSGTFDPSAVPPTLSAWEAIDTEYRIPGTAMSMPFTIKPLSRATRPVEKWECPFIFVFGGYRPDGSFSPFVWRATFNRLTFKPII